MKKIQDWLGSTLVKIGLLLYLVVGLVQLVVIPAGLEAWFSVHWVLAVICATALAWIPLFGQGFALTVTIGLLHWPIAAAAALFLWPIWFLGGVFLVRRLTGFQPAARGGHDVFRHRFRSYNDNPPPIRLDPDDLPPHLRKHQPMESI